MIGLSCIACLLTGRRTIPSNEYGGTCTNRLHAITSAKASGNWSNWRWTG